MTVTEPSPPRARDERSSPPPGHVVWDCHAGLVPSTDLDLNVLERWRAAGASFVSLNVGYDIAMTWEETLRCTAYFRRWIQRNGDRFVLVEHAGDVLQARDDDRLAVAFDLEGGNALDENVDMVSLYHGLGLRQMNLAYNHPNALGGGSLGDDIPLTRLGREVVAEMNAVGVLVDCSHTGYATCMDIMERSTDPVVFSHSNPRALHDHPRNIVDDQIRACAQTGGVIGLNGVGAFLGPDGYSAAQLVRHIEYVVELVGVDHVGIGLDANPGGHHSLVDAADDVSGLFGSSPDELADIAPPEELQALPPILSSRGFTGVDVEKIMGGNFLRVATEVWN